MLSALYFGAGNEEHHHESSPLKSLSYLQVKLQSIKPTPKHKNV
jgi:hypothetical protein